MGNKGPIVVIVTIVVVILAAVVIYKTATRGTTYGDENKGAVGAAVSHGSPTPVLDNSGKRGEAPQSGLRLPASKGRH